MQKLFLLIPLLSMSIPMPTPVNSIPVTPDKEIKWTR